MKESIGFKSGFVSIIGRPNVGKSTLLNYYVGCKIAIIADKPQTTRNRISGVVTLDDAQIVFIDTPGIHKPKNKLGEYMVSTAIRTFNEVDIILYLVDASSEIGAGEYYIINSLKKTRSPVYLAVNKCDLVSQEKADKIIETLSSNFNFTEVFSISAVTGKNTELLLNSLIERLPEGPKYYPDDMLTDRPEEFIIAELIREKVLETTREEVPYSIAVQIEEMREKRNIVFLSAIIYVERKSQKGILIGSSGNKLKEIGLRARKEIENLLGCKIYLDIWVKVKKDWRKNRFILKQFGYSQKD